MKKVSLIIPTFNGEKTIERAIVSVLNQKGDFEIEILICDDCSTDNTIEIAKKYGCKIFQNEINSGGPNKGRNAGIKHSTGDYIAFLDQDDEWLEEKLELQLRVDADVVYSQYNGGNKKPSENLHQTLLKRDSNYGWPYLGSLLIKNNNVPLFEEWFGQLDYDWLLRLSEGRTCVEVPPVVKRNITGSNLSMDNQYRKRDFYMGLLQVDGDIPVMKKWFGSRARYHYVKGEMKMARFFFIRGNLTWKTLLYFLSSYNLLLSKFIIKKFKVFGLN
jgi:glycosyltransferase involved in cell wall biosynthesis